jgi:hypothetical protein
MMTRQRWLLAVAVTATTACSAQVADVPFEGQEVETQALPLTTLQLSPTHKLEVYEPEPGNFLYLEQLGADDDALDVDLDTPEALSGLYRRLSPTREVPVEVAHATLRQMESLRIVNAQPQSPSVVETLVEGGQPFYAEGIRPKEVPRKTELFVANECGTVGEKADVTSGPVTVTASICRTERTGDSWAQISNAHAAQAAVRVYRGSLTARFRHDVGSGLVTDFNLTLQEGGIWRAWRWNTGGTFNLQVDVSNASGDGYHMSDFGTGSTNSTVMSCYDGGFHCGLGLIEQS